jgi:hypothetical protein
VPGKSGLLESLGPEQLDNYMASLKVLIETEEVKVEAQKQLSAAEQTVDVVPADASKEEKLTRCSNAEFLSKNEHWA